MSKANPPSFPVVLSEVLRKMRDRGLSVPSLVRILPHISSAQTLHNAAQVVEGKKKPSTLAFKVVAALADIALSRDAITRDEWEELLYASIRKSAESNVVAMCHIMSVEENCDAPNGRAWLKKRRELIDWRLKYLADHGE